ncbi:MAG: hypothetical protein J6R12_03285 [Bacteroidales bacterium]|nr:hypothetical protein [Bacteroidales bacterium]
MYNVLNFLPLKSLLLLVMLLAAASAAASTPAPSTSHPAMPAAVADSLFDAALPQVEVLGKTKRTVLKPKAKRLPAVVLLLAPNQIGQARSADIFIPRPFNLEEISFTILSNTIPGAVMSVEIYRDSSSAMPIAPPSFVTVPQAMKQEISIQLENALHLSPGTYRLLLRFVECDSVHLSQSLPANSSMSSPCMKFPLYLKQSRQAPSSQDAFDEQNIVIPFKLKGILDKNVKFEK